MSHVKGVARLGSVERDSHDVALLGVIDAHRPTPLDLSGDRLLHWVLACRALPSRNRAAPWTMRVEPLTPPSVSWSATSEIEEVNLNFTRGDRVDPGWAGWLAVVAGRLVSHC